MPETARSGPARNAIAGERDPQSAGRKRTVTVFENFKLHNRLVLVARREDGEIERMHWLRSVVERKGRFKIYSTTD